MFNIKVPLILASGSPRRQDFLKELGIEYTVLLPTKFQEKLDNSLSPRENVLKLAQDKARAVREEYNTECNNKLIVAADTIVVLENKDVDLHEINTEEYPAEILEKPASKEEALVMLEKLSGKQHVVMTAVHLILPSGEECSFVDSSKVYFHEWQQDILSAYANTGEGLDKAGAYAIQGKGSFLVDRIEGAWTTVVGFPVHKFVEYMLSYKYI